MPWWRQIRTWALHSWWMLLDSCGLLEAGRVSAHVVEPTLALLDAHTLATTYATM